MRTLTADVLRRWCHHRGWHRAPTRHSVQQAGRQAVQLVISCGASTAARQRQTDPPADQDPFGDPAIAKLQHGGFIIKGVGPRRASGSRADLRNADSAALPTSLRWRIRVTSPGAGLRLEPWNRRSYRRPNARLVEDVVAVVVLIQPSAKLRGCGYGRRSAVSARAAEAAQYKGARILADNAGATLELGRCADGSVRWSGVSARRVLVVLELAVEFLGRLRAATITSNA